MLRRYLARRKMRWAVRRRGGLRDLAITRAMIAEYERGLDTYRLHVAREMCPHRKLTLDRPWGEAKVMGQILGKTIYEEPDAPS